MQPRPTETSPEPLSNEAQLITHSTSQDGLHHHQLEPNRGSPDLQQSEPGYQPQGGLDPLEHESGVNSHEFATASPDRLNATLLEQSSNSSVAGTEDDYTSEYSASGDTLEISLDPRLEQASNNVNIRDLPNEVLVHVLAHLPPHTLSTVTLVSRRFYDLVTTPHAWRIAFGRFFPGPEALPSPRWGKREDSLASPKREFTRLSALASWRSEYTLRPKLLKALERGKPSHVLAPTTSPRSSRVSSVHNAAQLTYSSRLLSVVDRLHCNFQAGHNKRSPRVAHGTIELGKASMSDPITGKVDFWGSGDPQMFAHFDEIHPTEMQYGLGPGNIIGVPNSMDVSQTYGVIIGEGFSGGTVYYRSTQEQQGRHLMSSRNEGVAGNGIPSLDPSKETTCCVWVAKTHDIPNTTGGMIGLLSGSSYGIVTAYSTGALEGTRGFARGEVTAKWVLSPGVPIISIVVDEQYNSQRLAKGRAWVAALNALGEVFYLTSLPTVEQPGKANLTDVERYARAWRIGRSCFWSFVEPTRRKPKADLTVEEESHATYSPRSSWDGMNLGEDQIAGETREIEQFLRKTPKQIQEVCNGWDMRRRFEVDFASNGENDAGEILVVFDCGGEEDDITSVRRYKRTKVPNTSVSPPESEASTPSNSPKPQARSIFGSSQPMATEPTWSFPTSSKTARESASDPQKDLIDIWRESKLSLGGLKDPSITCTAIDMSSQALLTAFEDPLLTLADSSTTSPQGTPREKPVHSVPSDVPGQRARFIAVGTSLGTILVWNMRASTTKTIRPLRIISTPDVREVSCLALTALYLVHGDREGVVQAWDPLASTTQPIRTLHSRFSSRHRRQLNEMHGVPIGSNTDFFSARAISLDPDPTVLRGIVSLGTHLHYWSYSSSEAAKYKPGKRRLRRSPRGSNQAVDRLTRLGRGDIKAYIEKEQTELVREEKERHKEHKRMTNRFGTELLGPDATDAEIMAYATMLSEEAAASDQARALSESDTGTEVFSSSPVVVGSYTESEDADLAKAMALSLQETGSVVPDPPSNFEHEFDIPVRYAKKKGGRRSPSSSPPITAAGSSQQPEVDDLDFALQLSRAEMQSLSEWQEDFPELERRSSDEVEGKGKGKRRKS